MKKKDLPSPIVKENYNRYDKDNIIIKTITDKISIKDDIKEIIKEIEEDISKEGD